MNQPRSILIVDDHPLFRMGVRSLVDASGAFCTAGEAGDAAEAKRLAAQLRPDCVLMDLSLPDASGMELIAEMKTVCPKARVIVLSMHSAMDMVAESFRAGAMGYIVKESAGERLIQALEAVGRGEQYLDSAISPQVISRLMDYAERKTGSTHSSYDALTRREQQILRFLAEGDLPKAIAEKLFISRKTVENHRTNIMTKLGLKTPLELVRYAMRMGLVDVEEHHCRADSPRP
ncbi:response regulator transcription factor [Fundidesulfovibrio butyratiphilus]